MASSLGKMPTTSASHDLAVEPLDGIGRADLVPMLPPTHESEDVDFCLIMSRAASPRGLARN